VIPVEDERDVVLIPLVPLIERFPPNTPDASHVKRVVDVGFEPRSTYDEVDTIAPVDEFKYPSRASIDVFTAVKLLFMIVLEAENEFVAKIVCNVIAISLLDFYIYSIYLFLKIKF
jgi:hypothetical protein